MQSTLLAAGFPSITPDANGLPGLSTMHGLVSGLEFFTLGVCVIGILAGVAVWAAGAHSNNHHSHTGRIAILVSAIGALAAGASVPITNFAFAQGGTFH